MLINDFEYIFGDEEEQKESLRLSEKKQQEGFEDVISGQIKHLQSKLIDKHV